MMQVAALYVDSKGVYPTLPDVDCWDEVRDARDYVENHPVVAHPPCQLWVNFAYLNFKRWGGEHNRPGNDGGCFKSALANVRRCGGVLEHPAGSRAWAAHFLMKPTKPGWMRVHPEEWVCEVWQSAYGHKARKRTWLLYASPGKFSPYELDWARNPGTHQVGGFDNTRADGVRKRTLTKKEAIHSPVAFAEILVCLARRAVAGR